MFSSTCIVSWKSLNFWKIAFTKKLCKIPVCNIWKLEVTLWSDRWIWNKIYQMIFKNSLKPCTSLQNSERVQNHASVQIKVTVYLFYSSISCAWTTFLIQCLELWPLLLGMFPENKSSGFFCWRHQQTFNNSCNYDMQTA